MNKEEILKILRNNIDVNFSKKAINEISNSKCYFSTFSEPFDLEQQIYVLKKRLTLKKEKYADDVNPMQKLIDNLMITNLKAIDIILIATPNRVYSVYLDKVHFLIFGIIYSNDKNYDTILGLQKVYSAKGLSSNKWRPL